MKEMAARQAAEEAEVVEAETEEVKEIEAE